MFYKDQPTYNPQGLVFSPKKMKNSVSHSQRSKNNPTSTVSGGISTDPYIQEYSNYPDGIITIRSANGNKDHPTQKPVALFEYLIKTYTNPGDLVLDNCAGSGTTAIAALNTGRDFILIEQDAKYCDVIAKRILNHSQNPG